MMGVQEEMLFILSIPVYMLWLISLGKLGSIFFRKRGGVWKYVCCLCLLTVVQVWAAGNYMVYSVLQQAVLILFLCAASCRKNMPLRQRMACPARSGEGQSPLGWRSFLRDSFCGNGWEKAGLSCVLVAVWEFVWNGINSVLSIFNILFLNNRQSSYLLSAVSFLCTFVCLYLLFGRTTLAEGNLLRGGGKVLFSVVGLLLILIDLCNFGITRGIVMVSDNGAEYWDITHNELLTHLEVLTISALCMVISMSLLFGINRLIGYIAVDNLRKMEISRYQGILEQYRKQANVRHDLKNHFISMSVLAEQGEWDRLKEYLSKICSAGLVGEEDIETGNSVVNAIINAKRQTAGQRGIVFDCSVNITRPLAIDEYDLCIIWGNILDNAIQAAGAAQEKFIYVQAEVVKKNLVISVKNSVAAEMAQRDFGRRDWGTGLWNVYKIVQKEKGILDIKVTDACFEVSILLPVVV